MDPSTSARSALHYALEKFRRPRGRPPKTWLSIMKQQLRSELNMNWNEAFDIAKDENVWKTLIIGIVGKQLTKGYTLKTCTLGCTQHALKQDYLEPEGMFYQKQKSAGISQRSFTFTLNIFFYRYC